MIFGNYSAIVKGAKMKVRSAREESFVDLCVQEWCAKFTDHFLYEIKDCVGCVGLRKMTQQRGLESIGSLCNAPVL